MDAVQFIEYAHEIRVSPSAQTLKPDAYMNNEMPEGLTSAAQKFYLKARLIYLNKPSPDRGAREMTELERTYEYDKLAEHDKHGLAELWKRIEAAATEYSKNPSVETGDRFYAAVYGLTNDWRLKRDVN